MSFGFQMNAEDGTPIIDIQNPVLEVRGRGVTRLLREYPYDQFWAHPPQPWDKLVSAFDQGLPPPQFRLAGAMETDRAWSTVDGVTFPVINLPDGGGVSDTIFYQPGTTPISQSCEVVFDAGLDPLLPTGVLGVIDQAGIPYTCARSCSPASYPERFGMQVHNDQGDLLFDSRADHLAIRRALILRKAVMDDIIDGITPVVNMTLPEPMPNAWIAAPIFVPYRLQFRRKWAGRWEYYESHIQFSQPDPSTVRFERFTRLIKTGEQTPYTYTHDAIFYLARSAPPQS